MRLMENTLHLTLFLTIIFCSTSIIAQNVVKEYSRPVVVSGTNGVPNAASANNTVLFRGNSAVILKTNFFASGYSSSTSNGAYFRAFLGPVSYAVLKKEMDDYYYNTIDGTLHFRYDEKYLDAGNLNYKIFDYQRNVIATNIDLKVDFVGANFYSIDLKSIPSFVARNFALEENKYYTLEVLNGKNDKWVIRFKYIPVQ